MSTYSWALGADPGASGAIVALRSLDRVVVQVESIRLDQSERDLCDWMAGVLPTDDDNESVWGCIERVSASPGSGVSGMFRFGQSYGALRMLFTAHHVPFDLIQPLKWQTAMGCARPKGEPKESQTAHKNRTKARAQQLFPKIKVTHIIGDALLIAEFARRVRSGELK